MTLYWHRVHTGYYIADPYGDPKVELGGDLYVIRTTPALLERTPQVPWRVESPDGIILASAVSFSQAKRIALEDQPKWLAGMRML